MSHDDNNYQTFLHNTPAGYTHGHSHTPSIQVHGGGVVRVQHMGTATPQEAAPARESTRVYTGPIRVNMGPGGEVSDVGVARHVHSDAGQLGGSVASTFRSGAHGGSVETRPGDPTSRTLVASAMREGLVTRNAAGQLVDKGTIPALPATPAEQARAASDALAAANQRQEPTQGETLTGHILGTETAADLLADLTDHGVDQGAFDRAQARAIELAVTGSDDRSALATALAQETGMPLERAQQFATNGIDVYQAAADDIMAKLGLEGEDLQQAYSYMRAKPGALRHVIQSFAVANDPGPLKKYAMEFIGQRLGKGRA